MGFDLQPYGGPGGSYDDFGERSTGVTVELVGVGANLNRGDIRVARVIDAYSDLGPAGVSTGIYSFDNTINVEIDGVSSAVSYGDLSVSTAVTQSVTNDALTATLGTITASIPVTVTLGDVAGTGSTNDVTVALGSTVTLSTDTLTATLGSVTVQGNINIEGVSATAGLGSLTLSTAQVLTPATDAATGTVGTITPLVGPLVSLSTAALSGGLGTLAVSVPDADVRSNVSDLGLSGVPGGTYSSFVRGETSVTVEIDAVSATTGTRSFDAFSLIQEPDGVEGTASTGTLSVGSDHIETLAGVSGTASTGDIILPQTQVPTGVVATGQAGGLTVSAGGSIVVGLPPVSATANRGTLSPLIGSIVTPTGVEATTTSGSVTVSAGTGSPIEYASTYTRLGLHGGIRRAYQTFPARTPSSYGAFLLGTASITPAVSGTASLDEAVEGSTTITPASLGPIEMNTDAA